MKHVKLLRNFVYVILERRFVSAWVRYLFKIMLPVSFKFSNFLTKSDFLTMHVKTHVTAVYIREQCYINHW